MRLHKRAGGLVLGASVLFLVGTNVQAGMLLVLAALMLGAVAAGILLPTAALRGLEVSLSVPEEAVQGEPTLVELTLANRGRGVRWSLIGTDAHLEDAEVYVPSVRAGEAVQLSTVRTPGRRGAEVTVSVQVRSSAPFGVAERRRRLPVQARTLVLPRVFPLGSLPFVEPVATHETGIHSSPRRGHGPDYLGVREYRPGDPMRHVHWGLTARHGQVMVREFEEERTRRLAIVVDSERDVGTSWTPLDRTCAAAASIIEASAAAGQGTRLAAAGEDGSLSLLGRADPGTLHRWLAVLEPSGSALPDVLGHLGPEDLRGVETVVVVFPAWADRDPDELARAIAALQAAAVVAVAVGLADHEGASSDRDMLATAFERAGVDLRMWAAGEDLGRCLGAEVAA